MVVLLCAPVGWPFAIQLANRAASHQLTYGIGRFALFPLLFITLYVYEPLEPDREMPAMLRSVPMLVL